VITVEIKTDSMGNVHVAPMAARWRDKFRAIVRENGGGDSPTAFIQEGMGATEFLAELPARHRRDIERGYMVRLRVDPWIVGHWYGYDAHTAAE
jgi:hypothetical protein